ncbi:hypothetical protein AB1N83_009510 [Pleurotus pulmonarius]
MPPVRSAVNPFAFSSNSRAQSYSRRNCRGAGWHKRGYRDNGCMWINVRRGSYGCTRGQDLNERCTIREFWDQVVSSIQMEDGFPIPQGWSFEVSSKKKIIIPSDDLVTTIFDGGENVYVKIYDEEDNERVYDFCTDSWEYHVPGRRY